MFFGEVDIEQATGGIIVHTIRKDALVLKKGTPVTREHVAMLHRAGLSRIVIARLEPEDVSEDSAAGQIAKVVCGSNIRVAAPFTGRANLYAVTDGVLAVDRNAVDVLNSADESVTFATLPQWQRVKEGEMIATVKIIPFGIAASLLDRVVAGIKTPLISVIPFQPLKVAAISTLLPGLKNSVIDHTIEALRTRLAGTPAELVLDKRIPHDRQTLTGLLAGKFCSDVDIVVVFGASAIADRRDVIPAAIEAAGGCIEHFGMPVDPGNLLLLGRIGAMPVIGAPGCARSPRENGFDLILHRLLARIPLSRTDITGLGVGGLLSEIVTRPQPRNATVLEADTMPAIGAIVLAAGLSTRMGIHNKLLETLAGKPLLRHCVEALALSRVKNITIVTGHEAEAVRKCLDGLDVSFAHNPDYRQGLSSSIRTGIAALPQKCDGALIALGDMPLVTHQTVNRLIEAFEPARSSLIIVPVSDGKRGNPVLWGRRFFDALQNLQADHGGRQIMSMYADVITEVAFATGETRIDADTPAMLEQIRRQISCTHTGQCGGDAPQSEGIEQHKGA